MKCKTLTIVIFLLFSYSQTFAQNRFEIEADPIAYIFKGYSFHVGYQLGHVRFNAGTFAITQPSFFNSQEDFTVRNSGFGIKADYIFRKTQGFFVGLQSDYGSDKVIDIETGESKTEQGINIGVRTGYRFMLGKAEYGYKGLYLVPWIALIYNPGSSDMQFGNKVFESSPFLVFPTVHFGYRF